MMTQAEQTTLPPAAVLCSVAAYIHISGIRGDKICGRFNAYSYYRLSQAVDSHDISRGRGTIADVLGSVRAKALVVAISSDILFLRRTIANLRNIFPRWSIIR